MSKVTNGSVNRVIRYGRIIETGAFAEGEHTVEEMRVFVAEHLITPPMKVGDCVEQRYVLGYGETRWQESPASPDGQPEHGR